MAVSHEPPARVRPHPLWTRRARAPALRGWFLQVLAGLVLLVAIVIFISTMASVSPLKVKDGMSKLASICDAGSKVEDQGSSPALGARATLECIVNGEPLYLYVFPHNIDANSAVFAASNGGQQDVVVGSNWVAAVGPSLSGSRNSGHTAMLVQRAFGGAIELAR